MVRNTKPDGAQYKEEAHVRTRATFPAGQAAGRGWLPADRGRPAGQRDPAVAEFLAAEVAGAGRGSAAGDAVSSQDTGEDRNGHQSLAWYGDSAYGTGNLHETIGKAGHQAVIKPKPVQPAVELSAGHSLPGASGKAMP
jgi:hypothetical protein